MKSLAKQLWDNACSITITRDNSLPDNSPPDLIYRLRREVDPGVSWIIIDAAYAALNKHEDKDEKTL